MKPFLKILLTFFIATNFYAQTKVDSLINDAVTKKEENYYKVQKHFRRIRFTNEEIANFLKRSQEENYKVGEVFALNLKGRSHRNITEYDKAEEYYKSALELARKIRSVEGEVITLNQLGVIYRRQDKVKGALNYHQAALEIISKIKNPNEDFKVSHSISVNSIGNIYLTIRQYELALAKFQESIEIQKELNDLRGLAINHQNIGYAYQNIGDLDLALENFNKSLEYNNLNNSDLGRVICHNSISNILIKQGKYNEAYNYINDIVPTAEELGNRYYLSEVYNTIGWALIKKNNLDEAEEYLYKSLKIGADNNIPSSLSVSYLHLSELHQKQNNFKEALEHFQSSIDIDKKTFNEKNIRWVTNLMSNFEDEIKNNKIVRLDKEKKIAELNLTKSRNILIITFVSLALFSVVLYSIYRQRLLKNDKKILMLEQEALQSQMNPHFVFNALNSIKLYIINNEQKNAVYYLNKFSKLIRNILDASKVKEVSLSEELSTMNLYMSIENIRFSNEIEYSERVDEDINLESIKVPPLILQPFLENAIWHGLSSKKGSKKVSLEVLKISEDFIQIDIEDNGVGREQAFRIKKNKSLNRRSIGIDLTKQRLQNFTNEFKDDFSLDYFDLKDAEGKAIGTKVSIKIPLS